MKNKKEIDMIVEVLKELFVPEYDFERDICMSSLQTVENEKDYEKLIENIATSILTKLQKDEIVLAEGKVEIIRNWREIETVYLNVGGCKNFGLNDLISEEQAIELEGKTIIIKAVVKDE